MNRRDLLAGAAAAAVAPPPLAAIAAPTAPVADRMELAYRYLCWLDIERRQLAYEVRLMQGPWMAIPCDRFVALWHWNTGVPGVPAIDRAASMLAAAGITLEPDPHTLWGASEPPRTGKAPHPDADLLDLGRDFEEALAFANAPGLDEDLQIEHIRVATAVEEEIVETPARTVDGLLVKLRMLARYAPPNSEDMDERLICSIADDAERMAARAE